MSAALLLYTPCAGRSARYLVEAVRSFQCKDTVSEKMHESSGGTWLRGHRYAPLPWNLSHRKWLVAQLVTCGLSDKEITDLIGVAVATVKAHIGAILKNLGLWRRTQLVRYVMESGNFRPEEAELLLVKRRHPASVPCRPVRACRWDEKDQGVVHCD